MSITFYFPFFSLKINKKNKKKKKRNKQCYHCFYFIDRLCRLLSIFRPGQDAKLIVFSLKNKKKDLKKRRKKKKRINNVIIVFLSIDYVDHFLFFVLVKTLN